MNCTKSDLVQHSPPRICTELKFLVPLSQTSILDRIIQKYFYPDPHARKDGAYCVESLYYDTPDGNYLEEKRAGDLFKEKWRWRQYDNQSLPHFEIKYKNDSAVQKYKFSNKKFNVPPQSMPTAALSARNANRILYPALWIRYQRRAFLFRGGCGVRLTFDSEIEFKSPSLHSKYIKLPNEHMMSHQVIEFKYQRLPLVLSEFILHKLSEHILPFSKYEKCSDALQKLWN